MTLPQGNDCDREIERRVLFLLAECEGFELFETHDLDEVGRYLQRPFPLEQCESARNFFAHGTQSAGNGFGGEIAHEVPRIFSSMFTRSSQAAQKRRQARRHCAQRKVADQLQGFVVAMRAQIHEHSVHSRLFLADLRQQRIGQQQRRPRAHRDRRRRIHAGIEAHAFHDRTPWTREIYDLLAAIFSDLGHFELAGANHEEPFGGMPFGKKWRAAQHFANLRRLRESGSVGRRQLRKTGNVFQYIFRRAGRDCHARFLPRVRRHAPNRAGASQSRLQDPTEYAYSARRMFLRTLGIVSLASVLSIACGGSSNVTNAPQGSRGNEQVREQCNANGRQVTEVDTNQDGRPDVRHVSEGGRERCAQFDLNSDGTVDSTRFFAEDGTTIVREEQDFDFQGDIDQILYFENGHVVRAELDTGYDSRIDTWLWCDNDRIVRSERDRRHRGRADTWEFYADGLIHEIRHDDNNDGNADRWEVFEGGRLSQIRRDTDLDGEPDSTEDIPEDSRGPAEPARTCDGAEIAALAAAGGETPAATPPAATTPASTEPATAAPQATGAPQ